VPAHGASVLVADHEPEVGEMSRRYLARAGLSVQVVATPTATLGALASREADLFVIDLTMPSLDVIAVRRALAGGTTVPVVFLLDRQGRRPRGLADELDGPRRWLARPFSPRALADAVTDLLRVAEAPSPGVLGPGALGPGMPGPGAPGAGVPGPSSSGPVQVPTQRARASAPSLRLDPERRQAVVAGRAIPLTRSELAVLTALAGQPGRAFSRGQLLAALEGERGKRPGARAIDVYIVQLREKLGPDMIQTIHGIGYKLSG
jgi:DNA-binding response OmpR family regulator